MDHFAGMDVSVKETSVCIVDDAGTIVREAKVASEPEALLNGTDEPRLSLQADWTGSRPAVAMALQRTCRSRLAGDLCRDAAHAGGVAGADQQDGPQRCPRHGADDAGGTLSPGSCEDAAQPEAADVAGPSQAAAVEGHRSRERPARNLA